jgi:predicted amidohydrolase
MTRVATFALNGSLDKERNLENILGCIDQAADAGAQLVVFPEISLQGYPTDDLARSRGAGLRAFFAGAEPVPDGPSVGLIAERAIARRIHVVYGMNELGSSPGMVYNTAVLTGPAGHVGAYRKVHVAPSERLMWQAGDEWPVFDTEIGRIGLLICYDKSWPESCRELVLGGAELFVMPTAWGIVPDQYDVYERARALENNRWFISSNYAGQLGPKSYFGLSQIIDPAGRVVATSGQTGEQVMVTADIEVRTGIEAAMAEFTGARIWRDRRPSTYRRAGLARSNDAASWSE